MVQTAAGELLLFCTTVEHAAGRATGRRVGISLLRSKDGQKWSKPQPVIERPNVAYNCPFAADKDTLWLAFAEGTEKRTTLFLTRSADSGKTWAQPIPMTDGKHEDREPTLAVQDQTLFFAFRRVVPKGGYAKAGDVWYQVWYGWKPVAEITFPAAPGPGPRPEAERPPADRPLPTTPAKR